MVKKLLIKFSISQRASIDDDLRELLEQYGEQVVAVALALGSNQGTGMRTRHPRARDEGGSHHQDAAAHWLREKRDLAERRATTGIAVNIALLVFIFWSVVLGIINLFRGAHCEDGSVQSAQVWENLNKVLACQMSAAPAP
jgi:hypothetical protein